MICHVCPKGIRVICSRIPVETRKRPGPEMLAGVKRIYQHLMSVHARSGRVRHIVVCPGREIASVSQRIPSSMHSWLSYMFGGFKAGVIRPPDGTPTFVPSLTFGGAARVKWLRRERDQRDCAARKRVAAEPNRFHLSGVQSELGVFGTRKLSQPRLPPFVNHLSLDFSHPRVYIPHCPYGDDECDTNDAILEDLIFGG